MEGFQFLSCIRFSIQLLAAESAFLILLPRRERFSIRLLCGMCSYLVLLCGLYCAVSRIPGDVLAVRIAYYTLVFSMTLVFIWSCFDLSLGEVLFAGVGGYATQHIIYGLVQLVRFSVGYDAAVITVSAAGVSATLWKSMTASSPSARRRNTFCWMRFV